MPAYLVVLFDGATMQRMELSRFPPVLVLPVMRQMPASRRRIPEKTRMRQKFREGESEGANSQDTRKPNHKLKRNEHTTPAVHATAARSAS